MGLTPFEACGHEINKPPEGGLLINKKQKPEWLGHPKTHWIDRN
jgi:hypothetical protein